MYAVEIDVSKGKSMVAIICDGKLLGKPFSIAHTVEGFEVLLNKISQINKKEIKFVMEATEIYHLSLLVKLLEHNFFVTVENAFLIKKFFDVSLKKVKTDKTDSIKIAQYCFSNWHILKQYSIQYSTYQDLQFLSRQYDQQIALKVKAKVQYKNLVDVVFPNFELCFKKYRNI